LGIGRTSLSLANETRLGLSTANAMGLFSP
jgi:hypothetical protein